MSDLSTGRITNPILNSPYEEPRFHFRFNELGITDEILEGRRNSTYRIPIPLPKSRGKSRDQVQLGFEGTLLEIEEELPFINDVRAQVGLWRRNEYTPAPNRITRRLLEHWTDIEQRRDNKRLYFCQLEAIETAIYLSEIAPKAGKNDLIEEIRRANQSFNPDLPLRIAMKMATGAGKTLVMAMLIAWQALNKLTYAQDKRFSSCFLIVTPGITIKDRLRVLLPNDPDNYYTKWDLVPEDLRELLWRARIDVINYHQFRLKENSPASGLNKQVLTKGKKENPFKETEGQMVMRVMRNLGKARDIIVINDEAHHCYLPKDQVEEKLSREERSEASEDRERAALWINGLMAIRKKIGIRAVYDLSATPQTLRGSGYGEGKIFPWVVSDFSLVDAVESGIVKVPRVPVADNAMKSDMPMFRHVWPYIKGELPVYGRAKEEGTWIEPKLPSKLEACLHTLYSNYEKHFKAWESVRDGEGESTPPVFIVVCNNTNVSKLVYEHIAGWEQPQIVNERNEPIVAPGKLPLFSNEENKRWRSRPYTILIDSSQLESDEAMSPEFKKVAGREIETFKDELYARFPGRRGEKIEDKELLREVLNTIGKPGRLGEHIRCVVSVSMLTEGWDATTVSHILGVRAFGTQLLCEQVVGRGLRRRSHHTVNRTMEVNGKSVSFESFEPEYSEVYGVPFNFARFSGEGTIGVSPKLYHVKSLSERSKSEISFPRLVGYRYQWPREKLRATFDESSAQTLSPEDFPTHTLVSSILGENFKREIDDLMQKRKQEIVFAVAKLVLHKYYFDEEKGIQPWFMPDLIEIVREWIEKGYVKRKDDTYLGMLLVSDLAHEAADKVYHAILKSYEGEKRLLPILHPFNKTGSTRYVNFQTAKAVYSTSEKCHLNYVVADTETWEQKAAEALESMDEVICYVKNEGLGFTIPYTMGGRDRSYIPDFIVRLKDGGEEPLNLIVEISGMARRDKEAKRATMSDMWVPAINNDGRFGRWDFLEVTDPFNLKNSVRAWLSERRRRALCHWQK